MAGGRPSSGRRCGPSAPALVMRRRSLRVVTMSSPTPTVWPWAAAIPAGSTSPAATRAARMRRAISATVALSVAQMTTDAPTPRASCQAVKAASRAPSRSQLVTRPCRSYSTMTAGSPGAQAQAGVSLPCSREAPHTGELDRVDVGEEAEEPAGLDRAELGVVPDQDELGLGPVGEVGEAGEVAAGDHAGLVDHHDLPAAESPAIVGRAADGRVRTATWRRCPQARRPRPAAHRRRRPTPPSPVQARRTLATRRPRRPWCVTSRSPQARRHTPPRRHRGSRPVPPLPGPRRARRSRSIAARRQRRRRRRPARRPAVTMSMTSCSMASVACVV